MTEINDFSQKKVSRRKALTAMGGAFTGMVGFNTISGLNIVKKQPTGSLPNIIWLIGDDVTPYDHGCYGNPVRSPNIDRLAAEGTRFTSAFATAPNCSPSRTSMFTGKYPHTAGSMELHSILPEGLVVLPTMLRKKGYFSGNCAKLHLGPNADKQFDRIYENAYDWKKFVQERPKDKPFFLSIGFHEAHRPYKKNSIENPHSPDKVVVPPYLADIPEVREELALYYDEISHMDAEIGRLLDWLDREGPAENTLVVYFSDQGMPFPRAKTSLYDSGIGVPLIVRWKGKVPEGVVQNALATLLDLTPTMLEITGITPNDDIQGRSMLKLFTGTADRERKYIFSERNWHNIDMHIRCARSSRYKYIRNAFPGEPFGHPSDIVSSTSYQGMIRLLDEGKLSKQQMLIFRNPRPVDELYDLRTDPNEFENLIYRPEYQDVLKEFRSTLDKWIIDKKDVSPDELRYIDNIDLRTGKRLIEIRTPVPRKK